VEWPRRRGTIALTVVAVVAGAAITGLLGAAAFFEFGYGPVETVEADDAVAAERVAAGTAVRSGPVTAPGNPGSTPFPREGPPAFTPERMS